METMKKAVAQLSVLCLILLSPAGVCESRSNSTEPNKAFEHPGGLYSLKQIETMKARTQTMPHRAAFENLTARAQALLHHQPRPVEVYHVPYYYANNDASMEAKKPLSDDAFAAFTLALAYRLSEPCEPVYADKAAGILNAWAQTNRAISGFDGKLTACYCGVPMVTAAELLSDYPGWNHEDQAAFKTWLRTCLCKSADGIKQNRNNHGCWGLYTTLACRHFLDDHEGFAEDVKLLRSHLSALIDDRGELPAENKRTSSGMWYTYFALCPLSCAAAVATHATGEDFFAWTDTDGKGLKSALDTFFAYCTAPDTWPYERPGGLFGWIHNLFHPSAEEVKLPRPDSWPGNLYEAMLAYYKEPQWDEWLSPHRPILSGRGWMWATLTNLPARCEE